MSSILKRLLEPRTAAFLGIVGPLIAFICVAIAILVSPWFTWTGNALSDLGHPFAYPTSPTSSLFFNTGLVIGGIIASISSLGLLMKVKKNAFATIGVAVLFVGTLALICVGIFNETMSPWHFIFSVTLFVSIALSMMIFGIALALNKASRMLGMLSLVLGIVAATPWIVLPWSPAAIPEIISAVTVYAWILVICTMLFARKPIIAKK